MNNPTTYHGTWHVPDARGMYSRTFSGSLTYYGDKPTTLELIYEPNSGSISTLGHYDVILGEDAGGIKYSLFDATWVKEQSFSKITFIIRYILLGKHVQSLDEPCFDTCWIKYPFLNHWALDNRFDVSAINDRKTTISLDIGSRPAFLSANIEDGLRLMLWGHITNNLNRFDIAITQATNLNIDTPSLTSLNIYLKTICEFSQFLSIALFAEQHPSEIIFAEKGIRINYPLLFDKQLSSEPWVLPLIKFNALKGRMPDILKQWHFNYEQIAPICTYLIRSIRKNTVFDAPDFLIVAQALDGYFKRFVNKKDGKDTKQYKSQIEKLLEAFKDVNVIKQCNLDADVLTQTRHKYSHLIPDGDKKITKAVDDENLYWLTQKGIVLLTCCILNMLGLTTDEINLCCNESPLGQLLNSIPFWAL